jgi:hypothetical protein
MAEVELCQVVVQGRYLLAHGYRVGRLDVIDVGLTGTVPQDDGLRSLGDLPRCSETSTSGPTRVMSSSVAQATDWNPVVCSIQPSARQGVHGPCHGVPREPWISLAVSLW